MTGKTPDVAIVGGGICGLSTALALERRGWSPTVYEAASEYRPIGAGLLLQTNALLVLDAIGVVDRVRDAGVPLEETVIRSPRGPALKRFDLSRVERSDFGYGFVAIHRADLQRILLDEIETEVRTGMACTAVEGAESPVVRFDDGTRIHPDVLVGADGINSVVRDAVVPNVELRALDSVVYRAVVTADVPEEYRTRGVEVWGDGTYTGGAPIDAERFYWFATAPASSEADSHGHDERISALRGRFAEFPEPIPSVVESLDDDAVFVTGLQDVPPLDRWHCGSMVLAGDAAHGMLPFAGQGAAQAIEDALALAHSMDASADSATVFEAYEAQRKPRADRIRSESRWLGTLGTMQSSVGARTRNLAVKLLPDAIFRRSRRRRASDTSLPTTTASNHDSDA